VACVNLIPGVTSVYMWEGKLRIRDRNFIRVRVSVTVKVVTFLMLVNKSQS
jgi:uncharacterized protein involved in tolerance to divalent cations